MTKEVAFKAYIIASTASAELAVDEALGAQATRTLDVCVPAWVKEGKITRISYWLNPTAAVTYRLIIYEGTNADAITQQAKAVYISAAARADSTEYDEYSERAFILETAGAIYYAIDWSGPPGDTNGYIVVEGVAYYG